MPQPRAALGAFALACTGTGALGCRDVVGTIDAVKVDEPASVTFSAKSGEKYVLWSDYEIETSQDGETERYCYELQAEFRQGDDVLSRTCWPFRTSYCATAGKSGETGDCRTECNVRFKSTGEVTMQAKLVNTGTKCVSDGLMGQSVTCGAASDICRQALTGPSSVEAFKLRVVQD